MMKHLFTCVIVPALFAVVLPTSIFAQADGQIIKKEPYVIPDSILTELDSVRTSNSPDSKEAAEILERILAQNFYRLTYFSDGLKVTAYVAEPKEKGKYPCLVYNRGGNREFGKLGPYGIAFVLGTRASWGYVVVASQYRGVDGGEGIEEFGGKDIHDVLNLIPVLEQLPKADTSRIGIEGWSRGGMMTYLALKNTCQFRAAVVGSGSANDFKNIAKRPEMDQHVLSELIPDYWNNKEEELKKRSAVFWADQMCKTTPLLIMHGSSDWRVLPEEALELVNKLYEYKHPVRFKFYEGAGHGLYRFWDDTNNEIKNFLDYYVRDEKELPDMEPHGD